MTWRDALKNISSGPQAGYNNTPVFELYTTGVFAAPEAPHPSAVPRPSQIVDRLMSAVGELDRKHRELTADDRWSETGRQKQLEPLRDKVRKALASAQAELTGLTSEVAKMRRDSFSPPRIDKGDVVTALEDRELRDWVRSLSGEQIGKVMEGLADNHRLQEAILRSPVPMEQLGPMAERMFAERAAKSDPDAKHTLVHEEATEWAALLVKQVGDALVTDLSAPAVGSVVPRAA